MAKARRGNRIVWPPDYMRETLERDQKAKERAEFKIPTCFLEVMMLALAGIVKKNANEWRINEFSFGQLTLKARRIPDGDAQQAAGKAVGIDLGSIFTEVVAEAVGIDG